MGTFCEYAADGVASVAAAAGWDARIVGASESTCSLYVECTRAVRLPDDGLDDEPTGLEILTVRISDHGNARRCHTELIHLWLADVLQSQLDALTARLALPPRHNLDD